MNFRALVSLSSRNLSNSIEIGLMSLIRTNNLKPQAIVPPRLKAKSKVSLQIKYLLGCHCTCYTLHCILCTVPTPRVLSLHLTYSSSFCFCFCFSCQLRPVSLGPSVAIIYQSQASVPIGCSLPPPPLLLLLATPLACPLLRHICDTEPNVLCPCAAASQWQFMAPHRGRQQRKRLIKFNNFVKC